MIKNRLTKLISFILAIILIMTFPISAFAESGNGTGDDSTGGSRYVSGGASYQKAAYLIYIVDSNGSLITPVVEAAIDGCKEPPADANFDYELSKFGNKAPTRFVTISGVPTPFTSGGDGNGALLKQALLSKNSDGNCKADGVITTYFGGAVAEQFKNSNEDMYLIFEGVYWLTMNNGSHSGETLVATASGWAKAQEAYDCGEYGSSTFSKYTNNIFANCMKFEFSQLGLNPCPSGKQTNSTIMSSASGIISVWNNEIREQVQTTYDESKGDTPAKPADESDGTYTIVKNYRCSNDNGSSYIDAGCFNIKNIASTIKIENEQSYKVVGYKISTTESTNVNSLTWESSVPGTITQNGTSAKTVTLSNSEKCLYVLLEKTEGTPEVGDAELEISQSSLTKRVRFSEYNSTKVIATNVFKWYSDGFTVTSCSGHSYTDNCGNMTDHSGDTTNADGTTNHSADTTYCGGHTDQCSNFQFLDDSVTVSLRNEKVSEASNILVQINGWQNVVKDTSVSSLFKYWHTFNRTLTSASTLGRNNWDYVCVLWRGEDNLTVAQWKNDESTNSLMSNIGFKVANIPQGTRKTSDFLSTFAARFTDDSGSNRDLSTKYGASTASPNSGMLCTQIRSYSFKEDSALSLSNIKVKVRVYSGQSTRDTSNGALKQNQAEAGSITFYPYIKMKYDTYNMPYSNNYSQTAYVLGNYQRTMNLRNYCQVSFTPEDDNSLEVVSNQWSTHSTVMSKVNELFDTSDIAYKVIPGGAVLGIQNRYDDDEPIIKDVNVITYQCILEDDGKTQVDNTGSVSGDFTIETANSRHDDAVETVVESLKNLKLELYGNKDAKKDPFKGENISESKKFNGVSVSTDSKYNWDNFSELYLNVEEGDTSIEKYVFRTDTEGNVLMNDTVILTKSQGVESISNRTAKSINDKTCIVTQLVKALERNSGSDTSAIWAPDGKWYNEAFDGITVLVTTTEVHTGFWEPLERTTVFDPKLTPKNTYKGDLGTSFYVFQMRTDSSSDIYLGEENRVGSFMGVKVYSNVGLTELYKTDKFFSSSITTQDLK